jgi:hypothetical protein
VSCRLFTREEAEQLGLDGYKIDTFSFDYDMGDGFFYRSILPRSTKCLMSLVLSLVPMEPRLAPLTGTPFGANL